MLKIALGGRVGVRTLVLSKIKKAGIHFSLFALIGATWDVASLYAISVLHV